MSIELDTINEIIKSNKKTDKSLQTVKTGKFQAAGVRPKIKAKTRSLRADKKRPGRPKKPSLPVRSVLTDEAATPIWLSVSEAARLGGVTGKTIRRALQPETLKFRIIKNRYQIDLRSLVKFLHANKKLENKLKTLGIGQYIEKWRE